MGSRPARLTLTPPRAAHLLEEGGPQPLENYTVSARTWRPDGPGSFQAPPGVRAVHDRTGRLWARDTTRWTCTGTDWIRWRVLVAEHGPVTEATGHPAQRRAAASRTPATSGSRS